MDDIDSGAMICSGWVKRARASRTMSPWSEPGRARTILLVHIPLGQSLGIDGPALEERRDWPVRQYAMEHLPDERGDRQDR